MLSDISIEPFRDDLMGLEKMANSSWRDEYGIESFPNFYRPAFLKYFFTRIKDSGCVGAIEWTRNYYPMRPLFCSRFPPYFRSVDLVSWTFNKDISLKNIPSVYEVQS